MLVTLASTPDVELTAKAAAEQTEAAIKRLKHRHFEDLCSQIRSSIACGFRDVDIRLTDILPQSRTHEFLVEAVARLKVSGFVVHHVYERKDLVIKISW